MISGQLSGTATTYATHLSTEPQRSPPLSVAIYDRTLRDRGNVPNMFRTLAHRPEIFETIIAHMDAVLNTGTLPKALKELVIVRTSQCNRTPYCLASHTAICKRLGWTDAQLEALKDAALQPTSPTPKKPPSTWPK
jgi:AhpD family alkylhydroperoxidase